MTTLKPKKIPTLVGLFLVAAMLAVVSMGFNIATRIRTDASPSISPSNIIITNISDTAVTVTWMTAVPATGALIVAGDSAIPKTYYDERDISGKQGKYVSHSISANGLKPSTAYAFSILSDSRTFTALSEQYRIKTADPLGPVISDLEPAYGTVNNTNENEPLGDAVVYLTLTGAQTISTLIRDNGTWIIPLNQVRTADLKGFIPFEDRLDSRIIVRSGENVSEAICDTQNDSPVPLMIMGKTYDFRKVQAKISGKPLSSLPIQSTSQEKSKETVLGVQTTPNYSNKFKLSITQPKNGAALISNKPMFQGTGVPSTLLQVALGIKNVKTFSVKIGNDGIWRFTPLTTLEPGKQSVTITGITGKGKTEAVTVIFDILKSGSQVLGEATASATITPQAMPTIKATATPEPTEEMTVAPTETIDEDALKPTATPPVTAVTSPTLFLISISSALIIAGMILSFF